VLAVLAYVFFTKALSLWSEITLANPPANALTEQMEARGRGRVEGGHRPSAAFLGCRGDDCRGRARHARLGQGGLGRRSTSSNDPCMHPLNA
jgi:hypothetical protein